MNVTIPGGAVPRLEQGHGHLPLSGTFVPNVGGWRPLAA
jgi:hypothetical protein